MNKTFPLHWPAGWPRTASPDRRRAKFVTKRYSDSQGKRSLSIADSISRALHQLRLFGVGEDVIISTNLRLRIDGLPYSEQLAPDDPGAAVYWRRRGDKIESVMAIDIYDKVQDNIAAIAAALEAMRAIERHGGAQILQRAFVGFAALPGPDSGDYREILELSGNATLDDAETNYRALANKYHPDKQGGDADMFIKITAARDKARQELK